MCRLSGGWEIWRRSAALVTLDSSATVMKARRCRKSTAARFYTRSEYLASNVVLDSERLSERALTLGVVCKHYQTASSCGAVREKCVKRRPNGFGPTRRVAVLRADAFVWISLRSSDSRWSRQGQFRGSAARCDRGSVQP